LRGGVTTDGGDTYALNVIPTECMAGFDIRVPPTVAFDQLEAKLDAWTADKNLSYKFVFRTPAHYVSDASSNNKYWTTMCDTLLKECDATTDKQIFPAGTDGRYVRAHGIPAFGFSPMDCTPSLLHEHNERLNARIYLKGCEVYKKLLPALANVED
jgi:aminoacylase